MLFVHAVSEVSKAGNDEFYWRILLPPGQRMLFYIDKPGTWVRKTLDAP